MKISLVARQLTLHRRGARDNSSNRSGLRGSGEVEIRYVRSAANPANQLTAPEVTDRLARTIDAMSGRPAEGPPLVVDGDT